MAVGGGARTARWMFRGVGLALLAGLAVTVFGAATCANRNSPTDEYFPQLERQTESLRKGLVRNQVSFREEIERLAREPGAPELTDDAYLRLFAQYRSLIDEFGRNLGAMDPPADIEPAHQEFVNAAQDLTGWAAEAEGWVGKQASAEDAAAELSRANEVYARFEESCSRLQRAADDQGSPVDLKCRELLHPDQE